MEQLQTEDVVPVVEGFFSSLPDEIMLLLFSYVSLDVQSDLLILARVSTRWRRLACDPSLWDLPSKKSIAEMVKDYGVWHRSDLIKRRTVFHFDENSQYPIFGSSMIQKYNVAALNSKHRFLVNCAWQGVVGPSSARMEWRVMIQYLDGGPPLVLHKGAIGTAMRPQSVFVATDGWNAVVYIRPANILFAWNADPRLPKQPVIPRNVSALNKMLTFSIFAYSHPYLACSSFCSASTSVQGAILIVLDVRTLEAVYSITPTEANDMLPHFLAMDSRYLVWKQVTPEEAAHTEVLSTPSGKQLFSLTFNDPAYIACEFNTGLLISLSNQRNLEVYRLEDGERLAQRTDVSYDDPKSFSLAVNGHKILRNARDTLTEFTLSGGSLISRVITTSFFLSQITHYNPSLGIFIPSDRPGVFSLRDGRCLYELSCENKNEEGSKWCVVAADGDYILCGKRHNEMGLMLFALGCGPRGGGGGENGGSNGANQKESYCVTQ